MKVFRFSGLICGVLALGTFGAWAAVDNSVIAPGKVHEVCMDLLTDQVVNYNFKSNQAMKFNIHYHEDDKVSFPVAEHLTDGDQNSFSAPGARGYCLMWTNPTQADVELNVDYEIIH